MTANSIPANENAHLSFYRTEIGCYLISTNRLPAASGAGFETLVFDTREGDISQQRPHPVRCQWERDARRNHNAAVATARRHEFLDRVKVGEVLVNRWGDEHKIVDFFVVVGTGPGRICIQACGKTEVPSTANSHLRQVVPKTEEPTGKTVVKRSERHEYGHLTSWNGEPVYETRCA